jgi:Na+/H+-dicarboxylate symporter
MKTGHDLIAEAKTRITEIPVTDARTVGRVGVQALGWFVALLLGVIAIGVLAGPPLLARLPLDPAAAAALRESGAAAGTQIAGRAGELPSLARWLVELVPVNPVKAAADGAMLPLIVATLAFAVALTRVEPARRATAVQLAEAIRDAALVLVRWILVLAPVGVFALAVPLATRLGAQAAGAVAGFIVIVCALCVSSWIVVLYPAAVVFGRIGLGRFTRGALAPQAVAFSSRSSLAALPAMMRSADEMGLRREVTGFVLPLAASTFRAGAGIGQTVGALFVARLYGVPIGPAELGAIALATLVASFSVPGIPAGAIIAMVPVLMSAGIPVEGIGVLLAVDAITDMFRTTTNVTGDMAVAAILGRDAA